MIYYLFRHGQTFFSKYHLKYGKKNDTAEIIPEGIPKIINIAAKLKEEEVKVIYSSPIKRCVQTVEIIKKEVPTIKIIYYQSLEEEKVSRGLETFEDQTERIKNFLDEIKEKKLEKVAICSHGWPIAVMIALLKNKRVNRLSLLNYPKCGVIVTIDTK
jgi:broad specificity phosphatase PhoE